MLISAGDRIRCGDYALHSRFNRVINYVRDRCLVTLVDEAIGPGPLNLVFRGELPQADRLRVDEQTLGINDAAYPLPARFSSSFRITHWDPELFYPNLESLLSLLICRAPETSLVFLLDERRREAFRPGFEQELAQRMAESAHLIFAGRLKDGLRGMSGCGAGLTPSGDDFIAGLLTARHLRRQLLNEPPDSESPLIREIARSDNLISDALIQCAADGAFCEAHLQLVHALVGGTAEGLTGAAEKVIRLGATSGADWLTGLCMSLTADFDVNKKRGEPCLPVEK